MTHRKRTAKPEPIVILDEEETMEPLNKLLKLDREKFKTIQSEMRTKGLVLSQTWSDLFSLMSSYQAELITLQDHLIDIEREVQAGRNTSSLELERMKLQLDAKDREMKLQSDLLVQTRSELGRLKSDLSSKEQLIQKLQRQVVKDTDSSTVSSPAVTALEKWSDTSEMRVDGDSLTLNQGPVASTERNFSCSVTNPKHSESNDSALGGEKISTSDSQCLGTSSNDDDESEPFVQIKTEVSTGGLDVGALEELQAGTSRTNDTGQHQQEKDRACVINESFTMAKHLQLQASKLKPTKVWRKDHQVVPYSHHNVGLHSVHPRSRVPVSQIGIPEFRPRAAWDFLKKEHKCSHCGKVFSRNYNLQRHIRIMHRGDRPYGCHVCGRRFSLKHNWQKHTITHHMDEREGELFLEQQHDKLPEEMTGQSIAECEAASPTELVPETAGISS